MKKPDSQVVMPILMALIFNLMAHGFFMFLSLPIPTPYKQRFATQKMPRYPIPTQPRFEQD